MDIELEYTNSKNVNFKKLIKFLDEDLTKRYGELQEQYNEHNNIEHIKDVIVLYKECCPVACGAFKEYDNNSIELKRIFVLDEYRGKGFAKIIVRKLEEIARRQNYKYAVLETGKGQTEAINLYKGVGYEIVLNYGPYIGKLNSICMKKYL